MTSSRKYRLSSLGVRRSTLRPPQSVESSRSIAAMRRYPTRWPGSNSTNTSISLDSENRSLRTDPNRASFRIPERRQNATNSSWATWMWPTVILPTLWPRSALDGSWLSKWKTAIPYAGGFHNCRPSQLRADGRTSLARASMTASPATRVRMRSPSRCAPQRSVSYRQALDRHASQIYRKDDGPPGSRRGPMRRRRWVMLAAVKRSHSDVLVKKRRRRW